MGIIVETSFFGNFEQALDPEVLIIPTPYESTSISKGVKNAPQAILNASKHLESFDDELWIEINKIGINTSNFVKTDLSEVEQAVRNSVINGSLPIVLGGEHAVSYGAIKAIYDLYPDVSVLYFGARPNVSLESFPIKKIYENFPDIKVVQTGIRSLSREEADWLERNSANIEVFFLKDKVNWTVADIISKLSQNVYICFNFNTLDSSIMPSVKVPEPGGFSFDEATSLLKNICIFKEVVGMDFTDFCPIQGMTAPDFLAAKLIYKTIGYTFARELGVFEEKASEFTSAISEQ